MAILIRNMEMPKSCWYCRFELNNMCRATLDRMRVEPCDRHPDCPLISVPTLHGRLIDADALADEAFQYELNGETSLSMVFLRDVVEAPTIIESEE